MLHKWQQDFSNLYGGLGIVYNMEFYNSCLIDKMVYEGSMTDPLFVENHRVNQNFTPHESERGLFKCKSKKATGIDPISNEVLKNKNV